MILLLSTTEGYRLRNIEAAGGRAAEAEAEEDLQTC